MKGHYSYAALEDPEFRFNNLKTTRQIVDSYEDYKGIPIYITEYNTSYCPDNVIHDMNLNAAYLAHHLSRIGDDTDMYSYWTFGDIFEERGVPFTPFYGGFGMVANGSIPKPTYYTFEFYKRLKGECVYRDDDCIVTKDEDGTIKAIAWNVCEDRMAMKDKELNLSLNLPASEYSIITKTVDEKCCNPLKLWYDIGQPSSLSKEDKKLLREAAVPLVESDSVKVNDNGLDYTGIIGPNGVVYIEIKPVNRSCDRGYEYPLI